MQTIKNVRRTVLFVVLGLLGMAAPAVAQTCQWSSVGGTNTNVLALMVFDDGTDPALYVGGSFTTTGGVSANHIAKWAGAQWAGSTPFAFPSAPLLLSAGVPVPPLINNGDEVCTRSDRERL